MKKQSRPAGKGKGKGSSGWVRPDGTPLRRRKGDYFPDSEIEKRKFRGKKPFSSPDRPERPAFERRDSNVTAGSAERPFKREDRPLKKYPERPARNFSSPPGEKRETERKPFKRFEREESNENRAEKPARESRPFGKKPFEKKRVRYADKDHSKEMRGRFSKTPGKSFEKRKPSFRRDRPVSGDKQPKQEGAIRLNKYISNAGLASRREADDLITAGVISVNGKIVTELGTKILPGDEVKFHDQTLRTEKHRYVLLNKPKDFITTTDDPQERKTVMALIQDACKERILPVGRLDRNTTGLLLFTNDGELTKRLTHPSGNIKKIYQVELDRNLTQADMKQIAEGVELEDGTIAVDEIVYENPVDKHIIGVELHSGKNRVVRRIFESLGYKVKKLDRVYFAGLTKKDLPRGRWRFLTEMEVNMLKMQTGRKK